MAKIKLLSPAKVNLTLEILGTRADGYHEISSIMQPIDLFDEISIEISEVAEGTDATGISIHSSGLKIPNNKENLAWRAAEIFLKESGLRLQVDLHIEKRIPLGSGLGGGSGNAAAVLVGLSKLTGTRFEKGLLSMAPKIGADVAFFISSVTALAEGIGEKLALLKDFPLFYYVLICPNLNVSTKSIYTKWDEIHSGKNTDHCIAENTPGDDYHNLFNTQNGALPLKNDLETPAIELYPEIKAYKQVLTSMGAGNVQMTGSGSAVYAVFSNEKEAEEIYDYLKTSPTFEVFLVKGIKGWHRLV